MIEERIRFRRNPKNVSVPQGFEDLYIDANGDLVRESFGGEKETVGLAGSELDRSSTVLVSASQDSDVKRGEALVAAYARAKLLTPNGDALSATNRAQVIIPPGKYKLGSTMILDADFVDLVALVPEKGGVVFDLDNLAYAIDGVGIPLEYFRPPHTLVYTETPLIDTVLQTCDDLRLFGFGIAQLGVWGSEDIPTINFRVIGAFSLDNIQNAPSYYDTMYFFCRMSENGFSGAVATLRDFNGTWSNCIASSNAWTHGKGFYADALNGSSDYENAKFYGTFYDCVGGPQSFIGDNLEHPDSGAFGARFYRCVVHGQGGFGGCGLSGSPIDGDCYFEDCIGGDNAFGLAKTVAGTFLRCRGGNKSFAGNGKFTGIATDCEGGPASFGGTNAEYDIYPLGTTYCSGTLVRCKSENNERPMVLNGATLRDCRITNTTTGRHTIQIYNSNSSVIANSDILVLQGGTGIPIYAASALSAAVYHCRMNNAGNDADGIGSNVTNPVSSAGNVVSNSIR